MLLLLLVGVPWQYCSSGYTFGAESNMLEIMLNRRPGVSLFLLLLLTEGVAFAALLAWMIYAWW